MLKNYLIISLRNLMKRRSYSIVNVLGLATGMAICLLIVVFIMGELNYDTFVPNHDRIYRVVVDRKYPERTSSYATIPQSYAAAIQQEFPEVEAATRVFEFTGGTGFSLKYEDKIFESQQGYLVDSNFFNIFPHPFIAGDAATALSDANSIVITESTARTFFNDPLAAVGKQMTLAEGNNDLVEITGVIQDWPEHSHMKFGILTTTTGLAFAREANFVNFAAHTYLKLHPQASAAVIEKKFPTVISKYAVTNIEQTFGISFTEFQKGGNGYRYYLQQLPNIYLDSHLEGELRPNGSRQAIMIFSIIALAIFVIACINFINLSTARSAERAKEVGLRKTFGSNKQSLIKQFLIESLMLSMASIFIALGIALLLLPAFSQITNRPLHYSNILQPTILFLLFVAAVLTGLLAGIYPAFVLSAFRPIEVLKGRFKSTTAGLQLRNGLVVFQFAISVILIVCTIVVNQQMQYMTSNKLGFNQDEVLLIERTDQLGDKSDAWRNELAKISGVKAVTLSTSLPGVANFFGVSWQRPESREPMTGRGMMADDAYAETLGLQLVAGRYFSKQFATDSLAVIINERAVKELGLKEPIIGSELVSGEEIFNGVTGQQYRYKVIGVVKDFHYQTLHEPVNPLVINNLNRFNNQGFMGGIKISGTKIPETIAAIEKVWKQFVPEKTIRYRFLDKVIEQQYQAELTTKRLFTLFSILAIFIACIGLFGLATYATQQRTREIGIRKVLGASISGIASMLSKDFLKLVGISIVLAFPVAWFIMHAWLQDFNYRIAIQPWVFLSAATASLLIAIVTISFQTLKAALGNPSKTLRTE
jgi:putative ABC transport system permease protein